MLALSVDQQTALAQRAVMRRFFIWFDARNIITGDPEPVGFWDDVGDIEHSGRVYHGSGSVIQVSTLSAKGDMSIPGLQLTLSGIDPNSIALVRGESIAQVPVEVLLGIFDVGNHALVGSLFTYFTGFVDDCDIRTPEGGGTSTIIFTCESTSRALTIKRTATRSQACAQERDPTDTFYNDTAAQRDKPLYFGRKAPVEASTMNRAASLARGGPG